MKQTLILLPVLMQIILALTTLIILGVRRFKAYQAGGINKRQAVLDASAWPANVVKVSNNLRNQFEMPVLFYVLCLSLFALRAVTDIAMLFAWVFVISRYVHTYIHIGSNYVPLRFAAFATGLLMLISMTVLTIWHTLLPYVA